MLKYSLAIWKFYHNLNWYWTWGRHVMGTLRKLKHPQKFAWIKICLFQDTCNWGYLSQGWFVVNNETITGVTWAKTNIQYKGESLILFFVHPYPFIKLFQMTLFNFNPFWLLIKNQKSEVRWFSKLKGWFWVPMCTVMSKLIQKSDSA